MELLVHANTSGLLLVVRSLDVVAVAAQKVDVHVIMDTSTAHLLLWVVTIFVRVHIQSVLGMRMTDFASIQMLCFGMARFVRVVADVASSMIHHGSPRTYPSLQMIVLSCDCA